MKEAIEDARLVEEAGFDATTKLVAHTSIMSLRYLRDLAKKLGVEMEEIQPHHVIEDLQSGVALRKDPNQSSTAQRP